MIGVDALAAVTVFFPVMFFFISFVVGLGSGAGVLIGHAWGAGEIDKVKAGAGTTLTVALLFASVIAILGGLFSRQLLIVLAAAISSLFTLLWLNFDLRRRGHPLGVRRRPAARDAARRKAAPNGAAAGDSCRHGHGRDVAGRTGAARPRQQLRLVWRKRAIQRLI
jgi:hypothetical protein